MGKRANNAPLILNELQGVDRSLPVSADNPPAYMGEAQKQSNGGALSCNFGTDRIGSKGRGVSFDGASALVDFGYIADLSVQNFEISFSYYIPVLFSTAAIAAINVRNGENSGVYLIHQNNDLDIVAFTGSGSGFYGSYTPPSVGWHAIKMRVVDKVIKLYADGVLISTETLPSDIVWSTNAFTSFGAIKSAGPGFTTYGDPFSLANFVFNILDINGNKIDIGLQCNGEESSGDKLIDSSGKENNGNVVNLFAGFHIEDNLIPFSNINTYGYTLSDGVSYYYDSAATQLIPSGVFIPRDESNPSKCVAYTAPSVQADLLVTGKAPSLAKIGNSPCFQGFGNEALEIGDIAAFKISSFELRMSIQALNTTEPTQYLYSNHFTATRGFALRVQLESLRIFVMGSNIPLSITLLEGEYYNIEMKTLTPTSLYTKVVNLSTGAIQDSTVTIPAITYVAGSTCAIGGRFISDWSLSTYYKIWDVKFNELDASGDLVQELDRWPIPEPIINAATHKSFGVVNSNTLTLVNGSLANEGVQDEFHWGQLGFTEELIVDYSDRVTGGVEGGVRIERALGGIYDISFWHKQLASETGSFYVLDTRGDYGGSDYILTSQSSVGGSFYIDGVLQGSFGLPKDGIFHYIEIKGATIQSCTGAYVGRRFTGEEFHLRLSADIYGLFDRSEVLPQLNTTSLVTSFYIPASAALDGTDALGNPLTVTQDNAFLNYADNTLEAFPYPRKVQADKDWGYWFNTVTGVAIERQFTSFEANNDNIDYNDVSVPNKVKGSRFHKQQLRGRLNEVEQRIVNL